MDYAIQNDHNNAGHDDLAESWGVPNIAAPKISIRGSRSSLNEHGDANQAPAALQRIKTASASKGAG